jgi:endonuclease-3
MSTSLKRTTSTRNARVTLITPGTPPKVDDHVKPEPSSPLNTISDLEALPTSIPSLRRSARSSTALKIGESSKSNLDSNTSSYTNAPATPSPRKRVKREQSDFQTPVKSEARPAPTPRSSAKRLPQLALEKPHKAPERWEEQYRLIERMRAGIIAPVDSM